ncbi:hypothetical protein IW261DRAFT_1416117 [Armillaria novae-zelandiae]|uniref:Uncharacterized protein n=1 Tax=Armillaria novae-zelandiae TaxID=153914 RepID=A0AA39UGG8_9AGAR|nr:hypothetical protein IW261DRAFT_1416117 [Armillaria novae-zelandiae]
MASINFGKVADGEGEDRNSYWRLIIGICNDHKNRCGTDTRSRWMLMLRFKTVFVSIFIVDSDLLRAPDPSRLERRRYLYAPILLQQPHETRSLVDKRRRLVILSVRSESVLRELDIIGDNGGEASEVYVEYFTGESTAEIVNLLQSHVEGEVDRIDFGILKEILYTRILKDFLVPFIHGFVLSTARMIFEILCYDPSLVHQTQKVRGVERDDRAGPLAVVLSSQELAHARTVSFF